ncbi:RodZ domain-containing protein [Colwellia piezophila]|uniref:RodZ domain-containing protein n=1 Tax=Colwellia piezophila TaxID=211668 RepID=UPI0003739706|nr:RodZ domain-containing protein [Colwellia piezophila]
MNNDVSPISKTDDEEHTNITEQVTENITELSEDMEMVSPGAMLREARLASSLSQEHIASKLNFKVKLVNNIEENIFDPSMPVTFNRGYLVNYAKLVGVEVEDVLASFDALGAASIQRSELLSFSNETTKQAEHSRVMWLSYLIVAVLVGLTILWWQQESNHPAVTTLTAQPLADTLLKKDVEKLSNETLTKTAEQLTNDEQVVTAQASEKKTLTDIEASANTAPSIVNKAVVSADRKIDDKPQPQEPEISTAVFTFNGDCWVNIYDATGERIAWGIKKSGYVMTIKGKAPLRITVGKPELTSIVFNGKPVDMSAFNVGNIAKFNLPIIIE